jgi:hypothetical protein
VIEDTIATGDGELLEARWDAPPNPSRCLVLCHPHPLHGGTMAAPLMTNIARTLADGEFAVLRFNFRGVGASTGSHGFGETEIHDVDAAVAVARTAYPKLPLAVSGWSFGAATTLRWQAAAGSTLPYVGIALPVSAGMTTSLPGAEQLAAAHRAVILGARDQFTSVDDMARYTAAIGATLHVIPESDHFFSFRAERVAVLVASETSGSGVES